MRTITKLAIAAASGYALRAYLKKDELTSNEALKHSVDRRLSVEDEPINPPRPSFMERQAERLAAVVAHKVVSFVLDVPNNATQYSRYSGHGRHYSRDYYGRPSRYQRFSRRK
jgi:hypothetical protein